MSDFELLHPALRYHIANSLGWGELRPFQEAAVRPALEGRHMLVLAPTAGGKTEAALFPVLSRMLQEDWRGLGILYVCPIKALMNNLDERLSRYFNLLGRRSTLWHGDVSGSKKKRMLREPPDCLLITPESLEVLLTSRDTDRKAFLADVKVAIIDEIHAFAGDDRGWHLLAVLERVSRIAGNEFQRIGLSATVGNPEELANWLVSGCVNSCVVQTPNRNKIADAEVVLDYVGSLDNAAIVISRLHRGEKRLVFVDSRAKAESLGASLKNKGVRAHITHSSLGAEQRSNAERAFAQGEDCAIVATSVLELGVDVGDLDRVIQIDAPGSVASFLQRMGRTGRRAGSMKNALFLATSDDSLLRAASLIRLWEKGYVESLTPPPSPYHVFSQQLMALALQEKGIGVEAWRDWIPGFCRTARLEEKSIEKTIAHMIRENLFWDDQGILWFGLEGEKRFGYRHFLEILSVVAGEPLIAVKHGNRDIGVVHPVSFHTVKGENAIILLGGRNWEVKNVDWTRKLAYVEPAKSPGRSRWIGSGVARSFAVCQSIRELIEDEKLSSRWSARAIRQIDSIREEMSWLEPGVSIFQFDGKETSWWTFAGDNVNRTIASVFRERFGLDAFFDSLAVSMKGECKHDDIERLIDGLIKEVREFEKLPVDVDLFDGLKFSGCLPANIGRRMIRERMIDKDSLCRVLETPFKTVISIL